MENTKELRLKYGTIKFCNYACQEFGELLCINEQYDIYTKEPYELGIIAKEQVLKTFEKLIRLADVIYNDADDTEMSKHEAYNYLKERLDDDLKEKIVALSLF